jgi:hypothetical protein
LSAAEEAEAPAQGTILTNWFSQAVYTFIKKSFPVFSAGSSSPAFKGCKKCDKKFFSLKIQYGFQNTQNLMRILNPLKKAVKNFLEKNGIFTLLGSPAIDFKESIRQPM